MLNIGIVLPTNFSSKYVRELVKWINHQEGMRLASLIVDRIPGDGTGHSNLFWRVLLTIEKFGLKVQSKHRSHYDQFSITELGIESSTPFLLGTATRGSVAEESQLKRLQAVGLDLLVDCGELGTTRPWLRGCARLGMIGFSPDHNGMHPGSPAGFWECYFREPRTPILIGQFLEDGRIAPIFRGAFATRYWFSLNQAELAVRQRIYLQDALKKIAATGCIDTLRERLWIDDRPARAKPSVARVGVYAGKLFARMAMKWARRALRLQPHWSISIISGTVENAALRDARSFPAPPGRYWADPMVYAWNGKAFCFVEEYVFQTGRGRIRALELTGTGAVDRGVALEEPFHLSFPFVFAYGSELLMCPEAAETNQIRLYTCREFPLRWEFRAVIMDGISAADTMLFPHRDRWWMLTNIDRSPAKDDHCYELHLFWAHSPLSTQWTSHPQNPVKVDSFGARNAGMLTRNNRIYRFGQRQGFDRYGEGLFIYEISSLDERGYAEIEIQQVLPRFKPGLLGVHHLTSIPTCTVFDQARWALPWLSRRVQR